MLRMLRSTLAIFLCSGTVFAFGAAGCGDDDEADQGIQSCEEAVNVLTSDTCEQAIAGTVPPWIEGCVIGLCGGDPACVAENCVFAFITLLPPSCQEAIAYFQHEADPACRECFGGCTAEFFPCVLTPGNPPEDCVNTAGECLELCP
jgi:hypothetical protein